MSGIEPLTLEADRRRRAFFATIGELRPRLAPARLADDALAMADPGFALLKGLDMSIRRHPFSALATLAGAWHLVAGARAPAPAGSRANGRRKKFGRNSPSTTKEIVNGNAKADNR